MLCWAEMIPVVMPTLHSYLEMVSSELTEGLRETYNLAVPPEVLCVCVCVYVFVCVVE